MAEARACRLVVMPEWQGAGVGVRFLNAVCAQWRRGNNRYGKPLLTLFHTSHPGLAAALRRDRNWSQVSAVLYGPGKQKSALRPWHEDRIRRASARHPGLPLCGRCGGRAMRVGIIGQKWLAAELFKALLPVHEIAFVAVPQPTR